MKMILFIMSLLLADEHLFPAITGKTYQAQVHATCKTMKDGGCMIYTYCTLVFDKEQVTVSNYTKASCTAKEKEAGYERDNGKDSKKYNWHAKNNIVYIEGFDNYGSFAYKNETLIASKDINGSKEELIFSISTSDARK